MGFHILTDEMRAQLYTTYILECESSFFIALDLFKLHLNTHQESKRDRVRQSHTHYTFNNAIWCLFLLSCCHLTSLFCLWYLFICIFYIFSTWKCQFYVFIWEMGIFHLRRAWAHECIFIHIHVAYTAG